MPTVRSATPIIGMGLPKTGTTACANALQALGLSIGHNEGDILDRCDAIFNTLEDKFEDLDRKYPVARWIITYSENASAWMDSVRGHLQDEFRAQQTHSHSRRVPPRHSHLPCHFFGCAIGLPRSDPQTAFTMNASTGWIGQHQEDGLIAAYQQYYGSLFTYFRARPYALVDVRAGRYSHLDHIDTRLTAPFNMINSRSARGRGALKRCRALVPTPPHQHLPLSPAAPPRTLTTRKPDHVAGIAPQATLPPSPMVTKREFPSPTL